MPADHFKINQRGKNNTIDDLFFWINASMDITKTETVGIPKMREKLGKIRREIFDQPLWVVRDYFWRGKARDGLIFHVPEQTKEKREFHVICDDDRIDNITGLVKFKETESFKNVSCKPMVLTSKFFDNHFNGSNSIPSHVNLFSGMKVRDYDPGETNLLLMAEVRFALFSKACDPNLRQEECYFYFSNNKLGKLSIAAQSTYRRVICY
ncbi:Oidioi.mRNA.OKI2018_I69.chr2.g6386.t1.cds [Oikopleura dioica]|uniref:Oidioi.mRNA.OKI2018_I69.chr2.g6386.t1.cds n=1 Tax=Oikopleura dioica TaxID=34765 RepID=A0ABN7T3E9_OIKDI|nr:Oidioi.mRNA.OKI2018_I69.chr2.g6386.t1.cds [Oikopleura dioica]